MVCLLFESAIIAASRFGATPGQRRKDRRLYAIISGFAKSAPHPGGLWLSHRPQGKIMKEGIHPNYREVLFVDLSNGFKFVTRSCVNTKELGKTDDGRELPLFTLDTSSESHPFYTGTQKSVDNMGGRVEKFRNRFGKTAAK
jgi:large subunit ribosomal protein L31